MDMASYTKQQHACIKTEATPLKPVAHGPWAGLVLRVAVTCTTWQTLIGRTP